MTIDFFDITFYPITQGYFNMYAYNFDYHLLQTRFNLHTYYTHYYYFDIISYNNMQIYNIYLSNNYQNLFNMDLNIEFDDYIWFYINDYWEYPLFQSIGNRISLWATSVVKFWYMIKSKKYWEMAIPLNFHHFAMYFGSSSSFLEMLIGDRFSRLHSFNSFFQMNEFYYFNFAIYGTPFDADIDSFTFIQYMQWKDLFMDKQMEDYAFGWGELHLLRWAMDSDSTSPPLLEIFGTYPPYTIMFNYSNIYNIPTFLNKFTHWYWCYEYPSSNFLDYPNPNFDDLWIKHMSYIYAIRIIDYYYPSTMCEYDLIQYIYSNSYYQNNVVFFCAIFVLLIAFFWFLVHWIFVLSLSLSVLFMWIWNTLFVIKSEDFDYIIKNRKNYYKMMTLSYLKYWFFHIYLEKKKDYLYKRHFYDVIYSFSLNRSKMTYLVGLLMYVKGRIANYMQQQLNSRGSLSKTEKLELFSYKIEAIFFERYVIFTGRRLYAQWVVGYYLRFIYFFIIGFIHTLIYILKRTLWKFLLGHYIIMFFLYYFYFLMQYYHFLMRIFNINIIWKIYIPLINQFLIWFYFGFIYVRVQFFSYWLFSWSPYYYQTSTYSNYPLKHSPFTYSVFTFFYKLKSYKPKIPMFENMRSILNDSENHWIRNFLFFISLCFFKLIKLILFFLLKCTKAKNALIIKIYLILLNLLDKIIKNETIVLYCLFFIILFILLNWILFISILILFLFWYLNIFNYIYSLFFKISNNIFIFIGFITCLFISYFFNFVRVFFLFFLYILFKTRYLFFLILIYKLGFDYYFLLALAEIVISYAVENFESGTLFFLEYIFDFLISNPYTEQGFPIFWRISMNHSKLVELYLVDATINWEYWYNMYWHPLDGTFLWKKFFDDYREYGIFALMILFDFTPETYLTCEFSKFLVYLWHGPLGYYYDSIYSVIWIILLFIFNIIKQLPFFIFYYLSIVWYYIVPSLIFWCMLWFNYFDEIFEFLSYSNCIYLLGNMIFLSLLDFIFSLEPLIQKMHIYPILLNHWDALYFENNMHFLGLLTRLYPLGYFNIDSNILFIGYINFYIIYKGIISCAIDYPISFIKPIMHDLINLSYLYWPKSNVVWFRRVFIFIWHLKDCFDFDFWLSYFRLDTFKINKYTRVQPEIEKVEEYYWTIFEQWHFFKRQAWQTVFSFFFGPNNEYTMKIRYLFTLQRKGRIWIYLYFYHSFFNAFTFILCLMTFFGFILNILFRFGDRNYKYNYNNGYLWHLFRLNVHNYDFEWLNSTNNIEFLEKFSKQYNRVYSEDNTKTKIHSTNVRPDVLEHTWSFIKYVKTANHFFLWDLMIKDQYESVRDKIKKYKKITKERIINFIYGYKQFSEYEKYSMNSLMYDNLRYNYQHTLTFDFKRFVFDPNFNHYYTIRYYYFNQLWFFVTFGFRRNPLLAKMYIADGKTDFCPIETVATVWTDDLYEKMDKFNDIFYWIELNVYKGLCPTWFFVKDPGITHVSKTTEVQFGQDACCIDPDPFYYEGAFIYSLGLSVYLLWYIYAVYGGFHFEFNPTTRDSYFLFYTILQDLTYNFKLFDFILELNLLQYVHPDEFTIGDAEAKNILYPNNSLYLDKFNPWYKIHDIYCNLNSFMVYNHRIPTFYFWLLPFKHIYLGFWLYCLPNVYSGTFWSFYCIKFLFIILSGLVVCFKR